MDIAGIPLRDLIFVATGVVGVYVAVTLLRLAQLGRHKPPPTSAEPALPVSRPPPGDTVDEPNFDDAGNDRAGAGVGEEDVALYTPATPRSPPLGRRWPSWAQNKPADAPSEEPATPPDFGAELAQSHLTREVRHLRDEVAALREEVATLKMSSRRVAPQYEDAMALAQRGLTPQDMADRCSISLAEAELVWALARGPQQLDEEDDYGGEPRPHHARSA